VVNRSITPPMLARLVACALSRLAAGDIPARWPSPASCR
jgi:hypothetical protein